MSLKNTLRTIKYCILSKRYPLHNKSSEMMDPFFIIGAGRSGNTLLRRILNNHSELFIPPETYDIGPSIQQFRVFNKMGWDNITKLIYSNFEFNAEFHTFGLDSLADLYRNVSKYDEEKQSMAHILNAFYMHYRKKHNIKSIRWGDKTPLNILFLQEIKDVFPRAKFIHIIRDPYDAIYSVQKSGLGNDVAFTTQRWIEVNDMAYRFGERYPESYYFIKYENFIQDPSGETREMCKFLKIKFEDEMLLHIPEANKLGDVATLKHHQNVMKPISKDSIGKGLKNLSQDDLKIINPILKK